MGATTFFTVGKGKDAKSAFHKAVENALWNYGHRGYTGSIAEKDSFKIISYADEKKNGESKLDFMNRLISEADRRIDDKWGPAGCIVGDESDSWIFFGWASE